MNILKMVHIKKKSQKIKIKFIQVTSDLKKYKISPNGPLK